MTSGERWGPYPLILAGAVVALLVTVLWSLRWGGFALGALLMVGAAFRFAGYGGALAVRGKIADVVMLGGFGFVVVLAALLVDNDMLKTAIMSVFGGR